jgi:hypothetical protein
VLCGGKDACDISLLCTELYTKQERGFGRSGTSQKMCDFGKNSGPLFFLCLIISKKAMLKV